MADLVVVDSISECMLRGETFQAMKAGLFHKEDMIELGNTIQRKELRRSSDEQITVADLTGVAVQDVQISMAVFDALRQ